MKSKILLFYILIFQIISFTSCTKEKKVEDTLDEVKNTSDIDSLLSFSLNFDSAKNKGLSKDIEGVIESTDSTRISFVLPYKKRELITKLVPTIKFIGKKIEPHPSKIKDFSSPVAFTITSEKGESKTYTVTVSVSKPISENKILSFSITKPNDVKAQILTTINEDSSSISISLTDLSYYDLEKIKNIVPSIRISEFASISENSKSIDLSIIPTGAVKYTVTAESGTSKDYTVNITHELKKFISKWKTTSSNEQIQLPIYTGGSYDFRVDWGDGTAEQKITSYDDYTKSHRYATPGEKTITITGKIEGFNFLKIPNSKDKILDISDWGDMKFGNYGWYFMRCEKLTSLPMETPNLDGVTNMQSMFYGATAFNGDISKWDVSKVTNMNSMFRKATAFNGDISKWDVSKVTNMQGMFDDATAFNQNIGSWNVSKVTNMSWMFSNATAFNQNIGTWKVDNVRDMAMMFKDATAFNQDLSKWKVDNVTDMSDMFYFATSFNSDISNWNVSNVTNMRWMFYGAKSFNSDISNWNVSNVTDMQWMFSSNTKLYKGLI
ncbi:BspA family leucine-rich repeat surface protein [Ichthyobacterium seriolicida]|uniref:PKD domain-containing protein n=1 Tax=Ichthyobacterium seriolicida TaxID=242600 RepID=A0A1J1E7R1_9FLAO|nr:BspA family leucine-rich repeat surface protein [Ichthyobacterium seriolicida]BAV95374.1 hypothetical protein JBKA6_1361 [Ichthyobacterium seriolicida]